MVLVSLFNSSLFNGSLLYWYGISFLLTVPVFTMFDAKEKQRPDSEHTSIILHYPD